MVIVGTGIYTANFTWYQRRGKIGWGLIFMVAFVLLGFPRTLGGGYEMILILLIVVSMLGLYRIALKIAGFQEIENIDENT